MKKFLTIITVTCVLTSMLIVSAVSAGATGQLVINKKAKANVGDKVVGNFGKVVHVGNLSRSVDLWR